MIDYGTITKPAWKVSLELDAQKKPTETAAILVQHMIDIGDIIEQSKIEEAWWKAENLFEEEIAKLNLQKL